MIALAAGLLAGQALGTVAHRSAARIVLSLSASAPPVSPDVFGAIMDWPNDALGAYDARTRRFYPAFVRLLSRAGVKSIRFVDGNSARCCFEWQRAIGPPTGRRPGMVLDGLPGSASDVGPDEFGSLIDEVHADGMAITNFDRQSARDAAAWVAYMTTPVRSHASASPVQASYWAARRARNGHRAPYRIPRWDVGNEEDLDPSGWITGVAVAIGRHRTHCSDTIDCLYAFGGTTAFTAQPVVGPSDLSAEASLGTGRAGQNVYAAAPPVVPGSQTLSVGGIPWHAVGRLAEAGPRDAAYHLDDTTGEISFGTGIHGAVPPAGSQITLSYRSGPHDGFVQYYAAMKAMNPRIRICADAENAAFFATMGTTYPYDCVSWHAALLVGYPSPSLSDDAFMEQEVGAPLVQAAAERVEQRLVDRYARRRVPVLPSAYGHAAGNQPADLPDLHLSLLDGLVEAEQLEQWIALGIPVADRYQLNYETFRPGGPPHYVNPPQAADNVLIGGDGGGPDFVLTPDGEAMGLLSELAGQTPIHSRVEGNPMIALQNGTSSPTLVVQATRDAARDQLDVVVVNQSLNHPATAQLGAPGLSHGSVASLSTLDGPSATAYNSLRHPHVVRVIRTTERLSGSTFTHTFPAHSLTLIVLGDRGIQYRLLPRYQK